MNNKNQDKYDQPINSFNISSVILIFSLGAAACWFFMG